MPRYKLTYFDCQGRADLTRLLFVSGGVEFDDVRVPLISKSDEWLKLKPSK